MNHPVHIERLQALKSWGRDPDGIPVAKPPNVVSAAITFGQK